MAHFAKIENGLVTSVIVVHNNELLLNGVESESKGQEFCRNLFGGEWIQTSYNNNFRKQFAGVNFLYDETSDVFIAPKPYPSWLLNGSHEWSAPVAYPADGKIYVWDEASLNWIIQN